MKVTQYATVQDFYGDTESFLLNQEDRAAIMIGNSLRFRDKVWENEKPFLATVKNEGEIVLAAMLIPPYALLLLEKEEVDGKTAVPFLIDYLLQNNYAIPKIMSTKEVGNTFANEWAKINGFTKKVLMDLRLYTLKKVIPPAPRPGNLRLANQEDMSFLPNWIQEMTEVTSQIMTKSEAEELAKMRVDNQTLFIWEEDGHAVSMAAKTRPNIKGVSVNLVFTPKAGRGRGYASCCVAALSEHLLQEGYEFCTLYTDLANPTSNKIYQNIGYEPVCDYIEYKFEKNNTSEESDPA